MGEKEIENELMMYSYLYKKQKLEYYAASNKILKNILMRLKIRKDFLEMCKDDVTKLSAIQRKTNVEELTLNSIALSAGYNKKKEKKYASKLKICLKMYNELNRNLTLKIEHLKTKHQMSQKEINQYVTVTLLDLQESESKIGRYESELTFLMKKYPWLSNSELTLQNLAEDIKALSVARKEQQDLMKQIDHFWALEPDLEKAREQVQKVQMQCNEIKKALYYN